MTEVYASHFNFMSIWPSWPASLASTALLRALLRTPYIGCESLDVRVSETAIVNDARDGVAKDTAV